MENMRSEIQNVIVTGVSGGTVGEQIIKSLRMADTNYKIIAIDSNPLCKGFVDADEYYSSPSVSSPIYIDFLLKLCKIHSVKAIFPSSEIEIVKLSQNREKFAKSDILVLINKNSVLDTCFDKRKLIQFLEQNNFFAPKTVLIRKLSDIKNIKKFPVIAKPLKSTSGSKDVYIIQDSKKLLFYSSFLIDLYDAFIIQEYIGDAFNEYTVGVLSDFSGEILSITIMQRNILSGLGSRQVVKNTTGISKHGDFLAVSTGISQGKICSNPLIEKISTSIARKIGSRGPLNIQCRIVDGKVYVFEINPRFSGSCSIRTLAGINEPDSLFCSHFVEEFTPTYTKLTEGVYLRGLSEVFFKVPTKSHFNRVLFIGSKALGLSVLKKLHSIAPEKICAIITLDDSKDSRSVLNEFNEFAVRFRKDIYILRNYSELDGILKVVNPEIGIMCNFYWIINGDTLDKFKGGVIGIHASLLPKYRGHAPLVWPIINGEKESGVSLFLLNQGIDSGDIVAQEKFSIENNDSISEILQKARSKTLAMIDKYYPAILQNKYNPVKQDRSQSVYFGRRVRNDGRINWNDKNINIHNFIRAQTRPYPGAFCYNEDKELILWQSSLCDKQDYNVTPGTVVKIFRDKIIVKCGQGLLYIHEAQVVDSEQTPLNSIFKDKDILS